MLISKHSGQNSSCGKEKQIKTCFILFREALGLGISPWFDMNVLPI